MLSKDPYVNKELDRIAESGTKKERIVALTLLFVYGMFLLGMIGFFVWIVFDAIFEVRFK